MHARAYTRLCSQIVSYGEVFYSPSTKTVSMNEYLSSRASGTIKDKIRRSLEIILKTFPVCLELPKHIPERKMIQRPLAPTSVRELGSDTANILGQKQELLILQEFCRQVGSTNIDPGVVYS
ncbi:hypothetical protein NC653_005497 [Populus alba x Populus x berolinensis]|uniref:Uncharacterized protein n=1 Tax=Populus alba x Populus x berolinensis TaxID=444605 RepID=A0AAD6WBF5_9ROSI|nr:hypothetical protein NC653_005497 [Populus alba x Populus x berolinensis]